MTVSIGTEKGGREFCEAVPFPQDLLWLDLERRIYKLLDLPSGLKALSSVGLPLLKENMVYVV